jgi:hypothetical protein
MVVLNSLVFGTLSQEPSTMKILTTTRGQEFVRDEVLIAPSIDPYLRIAHANRVISSGKSLVLDAAEQSVKNRQQCG